MFQTRYKKHSLIFKFEAGTSRGVLKEKDAYFIWLSQLENPKIQGIGEISILKNLSPDDREDIEIHIQTFLEQISIKTNIAEAKKWVSENETLKKDFPAVRFGLEMALKDLENQGKQIWFPSDFTAGKAGIWINGLIWMGEASVMLQQIEKKIIEGYRCLKMKIGAIDFEQELALIWYVRQRFSADELTIRVDANGAFAPETALEKLQALAKYDIHSIEQPIKAQQLEAMAKLCRDTPIPIVLDEELIGVWGKNEKKSLLQAIKPAYIVLKPSLLGGFEATQEWIELAEKQQIDWWITSALEANIGLNAIAQYTYTLQPTIPQGLGTGQLYENNVPLPLRITGEYLFHDLFQG